MAISRRTVKGFFRKNGRDFNEVYSATFRLLKHISLSILHDDEEADGIVSDTYIKALESAPSFDGRHFQAWLCSIARNLSINQKKKLSITPLQDEDNEEPISNDPSYDDSYLILKKTLSEEEFDILMFHLYHDLPFDEIAKIKGGSASSVRGKYHRALEKVRSAHLY